MEKSKSSNKFFLFSFLPALLYWYLETKYPIKIALIAGITLSLIEIGCEKYFHGKIHKLSQVNLVLIVFLGGLSLLGEDGLWFKLQPAISLIAIAVYMGIKLKGGTGFFQQMMFEMKPDAPHPPPEILRIMERNMTIFFFCYGILMGCLALWFSTSVWAFFKTAGFIILFLVFMIVQAILNRKQAQKLSKL